MAAGRVTQLHTGHTPTSSMEESLSRTTKLVLELVVLGVVGFSRNE